MTSMKLITSALLFNCIGIALVESCILERNPHNEYPWMIKIYWDITWGHGSLIAPNRVLSAYEPFRQATSTTPALYQMLQFIASMRGSNGKEYCRATRNPKALYRQPNAERNMVFWELVESFDVGYNYPFLISSIAEMNKQRILNHLKDTANEPCYVPLFKDHNSDSVDFSVEEVKRTDQNKCKKNFPSSTRITNEEFCVAQTYRYYANPSWLSGAVILCQNKPLGIISETGYKTIQARGLTVFVTIAYSMGVLREQAKSWPEKPTTTVRNTATVKTTTRERAKTTEGPGTNVAITSRATISDETTPTESTEPSTSETMTSTIMTSKIPRAPMMTHPPSTTQFTGAFVGTPPIRAKYATRRRRSSMPPRIGNSPLIGFALCTIALQRLYTKYILHA